MTFEFKIHSIFLFVGPLGAGKTTFIKKHLIPGLNEKYNDLNIQYLSPEDIKKELIGDMSISKMDNRMMHVNKQASDIFDVKLQSAISYPVNADFVIIDTNGLDKDFRNDILAKAKMNRYNVYCVIFDYKNKKDFHEHLEIGETKNIAFSQLSRMRKETLTEIDKKDFIEMFRIKDKNFHNIDFLVSNYEQHRKQFLPKEFEYVIVSDIHGSYVEFIKLLEKNNFIIENGKLSHAQKNKKVLLVGDLVDKNSHENVRKVIEFCYDNLDMFYMVRGNHENFVYKALVGELDAKMMPSQEFINEYFDSIPLFVNDEELKNKFIEICNRMTDCYIGSNFVVTHAPCRNKNIGKLDSKSSKSQRTFVYPKRRDFKKEKVFLKECDKAFEFIRVESNAFHPIHIFGHVSIKDVYQHANKIAIDTGCYAGGHLTSIALTSKGDRIIEQIESSYKKKENLKNIFEIKEDISNMFWKNLIKKLHNVWIFKKKRDS